MLFCKKKNQNKFSEKNPYDSSVLILNNHYVFQLLQAWYLFVFSHFSKFFQNFIIHQLKKSFSKSFSHFFCNSVLILTYHFSQALLNLMTLCTVLKSNPWFNACFKFLMCIKYSFYHENWLQVFSNFFNFHSYRKKR